LPALAGIVDGLPVKRDIDDYVSNSAYDLSNLNARDGELITELANTILSKLQGGDLDATGLDKALHVLTSKDSSGNPAIGELIKELTLNTL